MKRPPIIVVVGHVDHGKTTLLDRIRETAVVEREAGGITQSIGAYGIERAGRALTFIDTPGHAAFIAMRARGAAVADLAVLAVASDDGVQEQTREAIKTLRETNTPFVVAFTKADRAKDVEKIKSQLAKEGVMLEGQGGTVSWHEVSAKTGEGIDALLDLLALAADMNPKECDPSRPARGYIMEVRKNEREGVVVHAIVTDGTLRAGDELRAGGVAAKVRALKNAAGEQVREAAPAMPVAIIGFKDAPAVGGEFAAGAEHAGAERGETNGGQSAARALPQKLTGQEGAVFDICLKADSYGALEAARELVEHMAVPEGVSLRVIAAGVGEVTDGDLTLFGGAGAKRAVVAFNVKLSKPAQAVAKAKGMLVIESSVVYDLVRAIDGMAKRSAPGAVLGDCELLAIFGKKAGAQIVGGKVVQGEMERGASCSIVRNGTDIGTCTIVNLQSMKADRARVGEGSECGMLVKTESGMQAGDHILIRA